MAPRLPGLPTFSALMLCVVLTAWLGLWGPINIDAIWRWQTLIGALIAGAGIFAASWNVTRQMRLSAQGREQDRIERELPGIRSALNLLIRFTSGSSEEVLLQFEELELIRQDGPDFVKRIDEILPLTPDGVRRDVIDLLQRLRAGAIRSETRAVLLEEATRALTKAEKTKQDLSKPAAKLSECSTELAAARAHFMILRAMIRGCEKQIERRLETDQRRLGKLRQEHERFLGLKE